MNKFSKEELEKFWNKEVKAEKPFFDAPSTLYYRRREIDLFKKWFGELYEKKLLKTDCWNESRNTRILFWAARIGARCSCFDISESNLKDAKRNMKDEGVEIDFRFGDVRDIPYPDNSFDYFYSMGTIEHNPQFEQSIRELRRVLKPNGIGIIGVPRKFPVFSLERYYVFKLLNHFNRFPYGEEIHFSQGDFEEILTRNGFTVLESSSIMLLPFSLRAIDVTLYKHFPHWCIITRPFLRFFEFLERHSSLLRDKGGYLLAVRVIK